MAERVAAAAAVGDTDVEQAELGSAGRRQRVEADHAAVVVGKWLPQAKQFARQSIRSSCNSFRY